MLRGWGGDRTLAVLLAVVVTGIVHCDRPTADARGEGTGSEFGAGSRRVEPAELGRPVEADLYELTLEAARLCEVAPSEPARVVVGVRIRVRSKSQRLYVRPEDAHLRSGGFSFRSRARAKAAEPCAPLFRAQWLEPEQSQSGFALFELPAARAVELALEFQPTVWGGADRVEVRLPELAELAPAG